jgi:hypothetical protein
MKRGLILALVVFTIFVLSFTSCNREQEGVLYQCKDGTMVDDFKKCPEMQDVTDEMMNQTKEQEKQTEVPENITKPESVQTIQRDVYKEQEAEKNTSAASYPNLNGWSVLEIVNGMAAYNPELKGKYPVPVEYNKYAPGFYTRGASSTKIEVPFYILRRHTSGGAREFDVYNFRIDVPVRPKLLYDEVVSKHNDSKFKLVYPAEWEDWMKINCEMIESCRDIEAIRCWTDAGDELYCWVHITPGEGYTEYIKYTMQAMNDDRKVLDTFEQFYCSPT